MAVTAEGNALTDDYRRRQAALAALMVGKLGQAWPKLDPRRIDETRNEWLRAVVGLVAQGYTASAELAAAYLPALRALERVPGAAPALPLGVPDLRKVIAAQALLGPIRIKTHLAGGMAVDEAVRIARTQTLGAAQRHMLDGGRDHTLAVVAADRRALGWARVCSGGACAFCQMLASAGPHYKTQRAARFEPHGGCNCTAEPVYADGPEAWPPRSRVLSEEWQTVTKGLSGDDARLAWRRHVEGRAGALDQADELVRDQARRDSTSARVTDPTKTKAGRGRELPTVPGGTVATTKSGRGRALKRAADPNDPAVKAARQEAELGALRATVTRLEARAAAGEDVGKALEWQRQRIAGLEAELPADAVARAKAAAAARSTPAAVKAAEDAALAVPRVAASRADAARQAERADVARQAERADVELEQSRAAEAELVRVDEEAAAKAYADAIDGVELDDQGHPWTLTAGYLEDLTDEELDALVDYCAEGIATDNPLELKRWEDLEVYLEYRDAYNGIVDQAGNVADAVIDRELADLIRTKGRPGLTHRADEAELVEAAVNRKPTRREVQEDYAVYLEELYLKAEDATRGVLVNTKGRAKGISGKSLLSGDVRRLLRYGSDELLEFFETTPRVQWSQFYAEATGSEAFATAAARQARIAAGIDRDRNVINLVTNREA